MHPGGQCKSNNQKAADADADANGCHRSQTYTFPNTGYLHTQAHTDTLTTYLHSTKHVGSDHTARQRIWKGRQRLQFHGQEYGSKRSHGCMRGEKEGLRVMTLTRAWLLALFLIFIYYDIGTVVFKRPLSPTISFLTCRREGLLFEGFLQCAICSRAGLVPGCPTHAQSERHHRCALGEPACT